MMSREKAHIRKKKELPDGELFRFVYPELSMGRQNGTTAIVATPFYGLFIGFEFPSRPFPALFSEGCPAILHHQIEICLGHSAVAEAFRPAAAPLCQCVLLLTVPHLEEADTASDRADHDEKGSQRSDESRRNAERNMEQLSKGGSGGTIFLTGL